MTTVRRRGLQIDDPLSPGQPGVEEKSPSQSAEHTPPKPIREGHVQASTSAPPPEQPGNAGNESRPASASEQEPPAHTAAGHEENGIWRAWSGVTGVGSFRLPHELLVELGDTARELGLPIGMIVTAAITQLLDQPPEQIAELVDRADDARIHGRRHARRRLSERSER